MRRWLRWAFAAYLAVLAYGVFGPAPGAFFERVKTELQGYESSSTTLRRSAAPPRTTAPPRPPRVSKRPSVVAPLARRSRIEAFFNVVVFVPFGLLVPLCWPRWRFGAVPAAVATSCAIEVVQGVLSWRSRTLRDVVWNSTGAVVGFGIWLVLARLVLVVGRSRALVDPATATGVAVGGRVRRRGRP